MQQLIMDLPLRPLDAPRRQADEGMARAADHAERVSPGWLDAAYEALKEFAQTHERFTSFEFRHAGLIESPTTDKAFGPVFLRAAKARVIEKCGFAKHPERHCSPTVLWGSRVFGMAS